MLTSRNGSIGIVTYPSIRGISHRASIGRLIVPQDQKSYAGRKHDLLFLKTAFRCPEFFRQVVLLLVAMELHSVGLVFQEAVWGKDVGPSVNRRNCLRSSFYSLGERRRSMHSC